jgi:thioredoxin-like negative regulator of GroEL
VTRALVAAFLVVPTVLAAQAQPTNSTATPMGRATMAERNGAYADAAVLYAAILQTQPATLGALIGMEHVLPRLDRRAELIALVEQALAADSSSIGVLGVAVRTFASTGHADSARKYVDRWAAHAPGDGDPYREWSDAALMARDLVQAKLALDVGRERMGPKELGVERAELMQRTGDIAGAVQEWIVVVHDTPPFRDGAVGMLVQVSPALRQATRDALQKDGSREARQMLGLLLAHWGQPTEGAAMIRAALPAESTAATNLLRSLLEALKTNDGRPAQLATASTLEAIAAHETGSAAVHTLMDAAHAYADAGDERNARRLLGAVASNPAAPGGMATTASSTLLGVLIAEGKAAEAEKVLGELGNKVDADEHDRLARRIAMAWARSGDFARAEQVISADSSTDGYDLRGRLRLFRGDVAGANDLLKFAGPYDDAREQSLERVALLSLIQAIGVDSSVALGTALLTLERGDSARAVTELSDFAATLKGGGAGETRLLAGRIALAHGDTAKAIELLGQADVKDSPATAAAARLDLARISVARGRSDDARATLEQLIIDFPESALVPEARRLRDTIRGAIPAGRA